MTFLHIFCTVIIPILLFPYGIIQKLLYGQSSLYQINSIIYAKLFFPQIIELSSEKIIEKGFIIVNHRSFTDFIIEPIITNSAIIGRSMAYVTCLFASLIGIYDKRLIVIDNKRKNREKVFSIVQNFMDSKSPYKNRILFFPEGTRLRHTILENID